MLVAVLFYAGAVLLSVPRLTVQPVAATAINPIINVFLIVKYVPFSVFVGA